MQLWTTLHAQTLIPAIIVMLIFSILLRVLLKDKPYKIRIIPIQVLTVIFVLLEVGKQVMSFKNGYDLYHIPLHFCSLILFALPAMAFYSGKHQEKVNGVVASLCASITLLLLIYPVLIYGEWNIRGFFKDYFDFHTVAFHNLVILAFMLIVALEIHSPGKGERTVIVWFVAAISLIQGVAANALKTNFANFYSCNIPPLEQVRLTVQSALGYVPAQILYGCIVGLLQVLFVLLAYEVYRLLRKAVKVKEKIGA